MQIFQRMRKVLNKRGEGYIDVAVSVLVTMMLIVLALNVFSFFVIRQDMDYFAREMVSAAAVNGCTAGETATRYSELAQETGLRPQYAWDTDYCDAADQRVQLGDTIKVTLTCGSYTVGFGIFKIPVTLTASYSGLSQMYWK